MNHGFRFNKSNWTKKNNQQQMAKEKQYKANWQLVLKKMWQLIVNQED